MLPPRFKPFVAALLLPPASLLFVGIGALVSLLVGAPRMLTSLVALGAMVLLWLSCCNAVALWLDRHLVAPTPHIEPGDVGRQFAENRVKAIVALGSGVHYDTPEYGGIAMLAEQSDERLRYALRLSRVTGVPVGFAGGTGWARGDIHRETEAGVAARVALEEHSQPIRWIDDESQDTLMNALHMAQMLGAEGIRDIALVTHGWHMRRARALFEEVGFRVLPAPTGFQGPQQTRLLEWLPSAHGLMTTRTAVREYIALVAMRLRWK